MRRSREDKQADEHLDECHYAHLGRDEEYLPFAVVRLHTKDFRSSIELMRAFRFEERLDTHRSSSKSARSIGAQRSHAAT